MIFEAYTSSKQPQGSELNSDLKYVAQMVNDTTFVLPVWASVPWSYIDKEVKKMNLL